MYSAKILVSLTAYTELERMSTGASNGDVIGYKMSRHGARTIEPPNIARVVMERGAGI